MSGHSDSTPCPNCGKDADSYTDWKPFNYTSIQCNHCGLLITPVVSYMTLEELNDIREEQSENGFGRKLRKLKRLPKQKFKY